MTVSWMKFFAALAMFATWAALVAWHMTAAEPLVTFCQMALSGLAAHMATAYQPTAPVLPSAPKEVTS